MWHQRLSNRQSLKCGHKYLQFTYWVEMNRLQFAFMNVVEHLQTVVSVIDTEMLVSSQL